MTDQQLTHAYHRTSETISRRAESDGVWCACRSCSDVQHRWEKLLAQMVARGLRTFP